MHGGPSISIGMVRRVAPFAAPALAALGAGAIELRPDRLGELLAASGITVALVVLTVTLPWQRIAPGFQALVPLIYFAVVALLRDATGGQASSLTPLLILPLLWLALYSSHRQVILGLVAMMATLVVPQLVVGAPAYTSDGWQQAVLWQLVASFVALTVHQLVSTVAERAHHAEQVTRIGRLISDDREVRAELCEAVLAVSKADVALLMEPDDEGHLVTTGAAGVEVPAISLSLAGERSAAALALTSDERIVVLDAEQSDVVSPRLRTLTAGRSVVFEPIHGRNGAIGVLCIVWQKPLARRPQASRLASLALLASEAAIAIERADLVLALERSARVDTLTGLPNRRSIDEELPRALQRARRSRTPLCILMLDIDRFKAFNDEHGHQAGDRLLKSAASAWETTLRGSDYIGRYGGEEFVAILPDCSLARAHDVFARLQHAMPDEQTASAGAAEWDGEEGSDQLIARADRALYEAKDAGRSCCVEAPAPAAERSPRA